VQQALKLAVSTLGLIPTYPVRNINTFGDGGVGGGKDKAGVFRDCLLVRAGTTVGDLMQMVLGDAAKWCQYAETVGNIRVSLLYTEASGGSLENLTAFVFHS
jgi:hypothetical protein